MAVTGDGPRCCFCTVSTAVSGIPPSRPGLASSFRLFIPDLFGFGFSRDVAGHVWPSAVLNHLDQLLDHLPPRASGRHRSVDGWIRRR